MSYSIKKLAKSQVEITFTFEPKDYQKHIEKAAKHIAEHINIKGFRKGSAPFEIIKREVGDMGILQEASNSIIQATFVDAILAEKLETVGSPEIKVEKMAPNNDFVYIATVAILPKIKLADLKSIKIKKEEKIVDDKKIDETLTSLRKMQAIEKTKDGVAEGEDKLVIDMDMFLDKVPVEGGQSKDYQVYLSEPHYIPGFNEELKGLKKDDSKEFSLKFPKDHYQKMLAGKKVDFKIKVKEVFERLTPELNDEFAKKLGQESVTKLKELVKTNLEHEEKARAEQSFEIEILEKLIEKSKIEEIPEVLIDSEKHKIFYELQRDLEKNGITVEQYLIDIKKTEKELFADFNAQAEKRAKAALISREIAKEQKIEAEAKEIDAELNLMKKIYGNSEHAENLEKPEIRSSIANIIQNKKVMNWLKENVSK